MKECTKCKEVKPLDQFGTRSSAKDGKSWQCRPCVRDRNRRYYHMDKERGRAQRAEHYRKNIERYREYRREKYRGDPDWHLERGREYREANLAQYRKRAREWAKANREKINRYYAKRRSSDPAFRSYECCRGMLRACLLRMGQKKERTTYETLGYSASQLARRMEFQFKPGMSWDNYGEWHIDHKIPVAHFIAKGEARPHIVNALCNLQPMWAEENIKKKSDRHPLRRAEP